MTDSEGTVPEGPVGRLVAQGVARWREVKALLRGEVESGVEWTGRVKASRTGAWLTVLVLGSGLFGAAMGWWRGPRQALFTAMKFPLVVLLTTLGNALLNAMLAPLLGVNIGLRQSLLAVLMSFTIAAAMLGSLSPLLACLVWNTPPIESGARAGRSHALILLCMVLMVALAGVLANLRLCQLLRRLGGSAGAARRVLVAWLAGNFLLGSQVSWILRPFIGSPGLPVQFLRDDPLNGSFFEAVLWSASRVLTE